MIDAGKYPVFNKKIYKNPNGGIVLPKDMWRESYNLYKSVSVAELNPAETMLWGRLNPLGAKLLLECNGEKTIEEIIQSIYKEKADEFRNSILNFFENAALKFELDFFETPTPHEVEPCGTFECYYPLRVLTEVTTRCNLTCQHCAISSGPADGKEMKKEDLFKIVEMFSEAGTRDFEITGGEPLLRKDIFDVIDKCCDSFYEVILATNGTLITREVARKLAELTNVLVQVSLDSYTATFYDQFRGVKGAFDKAVKGIYNLVSEGVFTRVEVTVTKDNAEDFEEILLFANELGVRGVNFDIARDTGRGEALGIHPDDAMRWMKEIDGITDKYANLVSIFYERTRSEFTSRDCGAGRTMWVLGPTGFIRPCTYLNEEYLVCGNLLKDEFHNVFSGERASIFTKIRFPTKEICGDCKYLLHCDKCFCNGVLMYRRMGDACTWGKAMRIKEWVTI